MHRVLECLTRFDEAGEAAVHGDGELTSARQERFGAVGTVALDEHDDRRREARERGEAAMGTPT